ncbi:hypothetical protein AYM40_12080 [Paraburkholderia phytofirmans OLGA172]|uniref:Uncharacterized protein n=1 Tax=Paraburkholderia phytofirmans OLGA172 TaxID=1417228 RepID=A0A160FKP5_9BURK|nr:hypothetical protein [Paraburkholderia phytofirmans]ANB73019.1 hypothetical protein AYM40_12080 [Paraburkholderia phytofirmans OLGA172]
MMIFALDFGPLMGVRLLGRSIRWRDEEIEIAFLWGIESKALLNGQIVLCEGNFLGLFIYRPAGRLLRRDAGRPVYNPESADVGLMAVLSQ